MDIIFCVLLGIGVPFLFYAMYNVHGEGPNRIRWEENQENLLFCCTGCERFQRMWQVTLHEVLHDEQVCVHCGEYGSGADGEPLLQEVDPDLHGHWLQRDPDCPEKRGKELRVFLKDLTILRELKREQQEQEELEAYNKKREVSYWQKVAIAEKLNHHTSNE